MDDRMADLKQKLKDDDSKPTKKKVVKKVIKKKPKKPEEHEDEQNSENVDDDSKHDESAKSDKSNREAKHTSNPEFNNWIIKIRKGNEEIGLMNQKSAEIKELGDKLAKTTSGAKEKAILEKCHELCQENKESVELVGGLINGLQKELQENPHGFDKDEIDKLCFQYRSLVDSYKDSIITYKNMQEAFNQANKNKLKRQLGTIDPDLTEREKDKLMDNPEQVQALINKKMMMQPHVKITSAVKDIEDKYNDILELESNINDLLELLTQINTLISDSGKMIDQIHNNFNAANKLTQKANQNLKEAKELQQQSKGKQWWMCICALGALFVIGAPILLTILVNTRIF